MSSLDFLPKGRVRWTNRAHSNPLWPLEPNLETIRTLAATALEKDVLDIEVRFLAAGANHNAYEVCDHGRATHVFRVAIPIDPHLKTASEIATLDFLRQHTTIPVPRTVAWQTSRANPLGYEWVLMDKVPGVQLAQLWDHMPLQKKFAFADSMAVFMNQLWSCELKFTEIGSLYHRMPAGQENTDLDTAHSYPFLTPATTPNIPSANKDQRFRVGPAIDGAFYNGRRIHLGSYRGPFKSCCQWANALIDVEVELIMSAKKLFANRHEILRQNPGTTWVKLEKEIGFKESDFAAYYDTMLELCDQYRVLVPFVFPPTNAVHKNEHKSRFMLHHCDLRAANIMVDPETFEITGILDWEESRVLPAWFAMDYPLIFNTYDPSDDEYEEPIDDNVMPELPTIWDERSGDYNPFKVARYEGWEGRQLRRRFDAKLQELGARDFTPDIPSVELKRIFIASIGALGGGSWRAARSDLQYVHETLRQNHNMKPLPWIDLQDTKTDELPLILAGDLENLAFDNTK
ncbi:phosphotransferase [Microdochium nivale]|nr:phosphotransferase [Microdochium nivale]